MLIMLLGVIPVSFADANREPKNEFRVYVCTLSPFQDIFADVGITENIARYKVQQDCEKSQGENSIFCQSRKAQCNESLITIGITFNRSHSRD
ncbi:hypothetical protein [uncultured Shewanella sp.]|uniref:hypothetical protein n=1 Tax=uncultured Shewanella sp. TaxID=173975 RepID=UPI00260B3497|nr:hypothetical protein [uncultured Shewanella sp.]